MKIPSSELVLNNLGEVYHLGLAPSDLASKIILVGDQGRVQQIGQFFSSIRVKKNHREFYTITGTYKGIEITVLSTGIGTDNIDIVINELDALVNIDLQKKEIKSNQTQLQLLRIGTCGIFQKDIPLHSYLLSLGAFGLDNVAHFYDITNSQHSILLAAQFKRQVELPSAIEPYFGYASEKIINSFPKHVNLHLGYTVTSSGFYGPQGRSLRLNLKSKEMKSSFENQNIDGVNIINFEMESSALFSLSAALGHHAGTICLGIANRITNEFSTDYTSEMDQLILYSLDSFINL
ncbi:MAG: nucleoside phosphorylase [Bacteroidetes bacterium]|nr:nucleoside phosphorylase [Bacteroidota bacterium]